MTRAIWGIIYDLPEQGRDDYLGWFHDVHMPEKLARPGYQWAAHYEVSDAAGHHISSLGADDRDSVSGLGYIALFGGTDTQAFLDPSPAQIKPRQTTLTRQMMGLRIGQRSFIAAEEWCITAKADAGMLGLAAISLNCCNSPGHDEAFGAWCVQDLKPVLIAQNETRVLSKFLAATGPVKHIVLAQSDQLFDDVPIAPDIPVTHMSGSPFRARRIAP